MSVLIGNKQIKYMENLNVVCIVCEEQYDRTTETKDIAESGERICPSCWEDEK